MSRVLYVLLLSSFLTQGCTLAVASATDDALQELAYDSGIQYYWSGYIADYPGWIIGNMFAVRFTPPSECLLSKARFYVSEKKEDLAPFKVRILKANREFMPVSVEANPTSGRWCDVDLSPLNVVVDSDFYIALEYVSVYNEVRFIPYAPWSTLVWRNKPDLGGSQGSGDRSYRIFKGQYGGMQWSQETNKDFMIRAVVQKGYSLEVLSPYGETSGSGF